MKPLVKYPIGQQSFETLRKGNYLYVDKTLFIEKIINGPQFYFLGRPRRFGKSLFLSTLKCFFEAKQDLFKDLYIDSTDWEWEPYPVLYLDFNTQKYKEDGNLEDLIDDHLRKWEAEYGVEPEIMNDSIRFAQVIKAASEKTGKGVVILVDEYDKPLVNNLHERERFEKYRSQLATLYSNFKSSADYIRLVFLTGVSRFGKLSVFSDLNNIKDISFDNRFSDICGITEEELRSNFRKGISELAEANGRSEEEELHHLKKQYDGYHFSPKCVDIYNPFSLLHVMDTSQYGNYWIESGTPSLLADQLKRTNADLEKLMSSEAGETTLKGLDLDNINPIALLYQTGYLTIKKYEQEFRAYKLGSPNNEVKEGFFEYLLPLYANTHNEDSHIFILSLVREMKSGNVSGFMKRLQSMFADIPYEMKMEQEHNVQNIMFIIFRLAGLNANVEYRTSDGRIDILVRLEEYVYIMELKYDKSAREALDQIIKKDYSMPWAADKRKVIAIGMNYSSRKRCIDSWLSEVL